MTSNGEENPLGGVFLELGNLERRFADVELDALRRKEYALKSLYSARQELLQRIPDFWKTVFPEGPEEIQEFVSSEDLEILGSLQSFSVERYQITSEIEGEPRSLRFKFEFDKNDYFEDKLLVKDFVYSPSDSGPGNLTSKPVAIKWKSKSKDTTHGLLDAAIELHTAEEALKVQTGTKQLAFVDRENLWQHEKLLDKINHLEEDSESTPSFFNWFGFRGVVGDHDDNVQNGSRQQHDVSDDEQDVDEDDDLLSVEIFPAGEEIAITLAEDFWPDVMDYFIQSQTDVVDEMQEDSSLSDDVPELVPTTEETKEKARPSKRQRLD